MSYICISMFHFEIKAQSKQHGLEKKSVKRWLIKTRLTLWGSVSKSQKGYGTT